MGRVLSGSDYVSVAKPAEETAMTMWVITPAVSNGGLILKIGTALLIAFAATFILVHAEVYFSDQLILQDPINNIF